MLQMQCECSTQKPLRANGGFMSRAQREMAQPPAGHETIGSMDTTWYTLPKIFGGSPLQPPKSLLCKLCRQIWRFLDVFSPNTTKKLIYTTIILIIIFRAGIFGNFFHPF